MTWGIIVIAGLAGLVTGAAGRVLLGRLRRGVRVRAGPAELVCAGLCLATAGRWAAGGLPGWWLPVPLALGVLAVPLATVDLLRRRLPDALTAAVAVVVGGAVAWAAMAGGGPSLAVAGLLGGGVFLAVHLAVHLTVPGALGPGDVKLAGGVGGVLGAVGWPAVVVGACLAAVVTLALAVAGRVARVASWRTGVPYGPGLLAAAWLVAVFPGTGLEVGPLG